MGSVLRKIGQVLLGVYVVGVFVTIPYCNWQYAREHGFLHWLFFGQVVPTARGFFWPLWVGDALLRPAVEREHADRFLLVVATAMRADPAGATAMGADVPRSLDEILKYRRMAVELGGKVSPRVLNRIYPDLGTMFSEKFMKSLELGNKAADNRDPVLFQRALMLWRSWQDWYNPRQGEISTAIKKRISPWWFQK